MSSSRHEPDRGPACGCVVKFAIRDDDTCCFTAPDELERVYSGVWDRVPVCLAVIPFAKGQPSPAVPKSLWESGRCFPLEENPAIVSRLKELLAAHRITIAQHGFTHEDFPDGWEFQAAPDPERRVAEGRAYLERLLETRIAVFVPPHNALSRRGLTAVGAAGLNILGSFLSFRPSSRRWDRRTPANWWRVARFRSATGRSKSDRLVYPHPLRYVDHAEFGCHVLIPGTTARELIDGFEEARQAGGDFCLATHYWEVDQPMTDVLARLLDHAERYSDVRFVSTEELFD